MPWNSPLELLDHTTLGSSRTCREGLLFVLFLSFSFSISFFFLSSLVFSFLPHSLPPSFLSSPYLSLLPTFLSLSGKSSSTEHKPSPTTRLPLLGVHLKQALHIKATFGGSPKEDAGDRHLGRRGTALSCMVQNRGFLGPYPYRKIFLSVSLFS